MIGLITAVLIRTGLGSFLSAGDGGTIQAVDGVSPYDSVVGIRFNTDGTVEKGSATNGAAISWSAHGTWYNPDTPGSPGNFSVRYTNRTSAGGDDFTTKAAAEDAWVAITTTRTWTWGTTAQPAGSFTCDFEVRDDVSTLPTASEEYTFNIAHTL